MFGKQTYIISLIPTGISPIQAYSFTLYKLVSSTYTNLWHYPIPTGMFQTQTYGITRYQLVCAENKLMALPHNWYVPKTNLWHYPDINWYFPKTSPRLYLIPTGMFQTQVNGTTLITTSSH
jgi:hypothetical protein